MRIALAIFLVLLFTSIAYPNPYGPGFHTLENPIPPQYPAVSPKKEPLFEREVRCGSLFTGYLRAYDMNDDPSDGAELSVYGVEEDTVFMYYGPGEYGRIEWIIVLLANGKQQEFSTVAEAREFFPSVCDALAAGWKSRI